MNDNFYSNHCNTLIISYFIQFNQFPFGSRFREMFALLVFPGESNGFLFFVIGIGTITKLVLVISNLQMESSG